MSFSTILYPTPSDLFPFSSRTPEEWPCVMNHLHARDPPRRSRKGGDLFGCLQPQGRLSFKEGERQRGQGEHLAGLDVPAGGLSHWRGTTKGR